MIRRFTAVVLALVMAAITPSPVKAQAVCGPPECAWPPPFCDEARLLCVYLPIVNEIVYWRYYPCH